MTQDHWSGLTPAQSSDLQERIDATIRLTPLLEGLQKVIDIINKMCAERRPPLMSIPLRAEDEDMFIITTLEDAIEAIKQREEQDA